MGHIGELLVLLLSLAVLATALDERTIFRCPEKCIPMANCPGLNDILKKLKQRSWLYSDEYDQIKKYNCYMKEETQYVCCPRTLINENNSSKIEYSYESKVSTPVMHMNTYFYKRVPQPEVRKEDPFADCGRTFNRNYQAGYNTELSDFPWLALLEFDTPSGKKKLGCGGVLITDQHVLTAAHCLTSPSHELSGVMLGKYDTDASTHCLPDSNLGVIVCAKLSLKVEPCRIIMHENYREGIEGRNGERTGDIALIKLREKVKFNPYIKPICLPLSKPSVDTYLVSGWGRSMIPLALGFDQKFMSRLTLVDAETCRANQQLPFITDEHICAGTSVLSEHPCISDAGGPLMGYERKPDGQVKMTVFGISYMDLSCKISETTDLPGVFTSLYEYLPWLQEKLRL